MTREEKLKHADEIFARVYGTSHTIRQSYGVIDDVVSDLRTLALELRSTDEAGADDLYNMATTLVSLADRLANLDLEAAS